MATPTFTSPATVPASQKEIDGTALGNLIQGLIDFLDEASNLDEANVDLAGSNGLVGKSTDQTITGHKTMNAAFSLAGTYLKPFSIASARIWYDTTAEALRVKHGTDPSSMTDGNLIMEG